MHQLTPLLLTSAVLAVLCAGCGDEQDATDGQQAPHNHAHRHGPAHGELAQVAEGLWLEFHIIHDERTLLAWVYTGPHAGDLTPAKTAQPPVFSFSANGSTVKVEGTAAPQFDNPQTGVPHRFTHDALASDVADGTVTLVMTPGAAAQSVVLPEHHH